LQTDGRKAFPTQLPIRLVRPIVACASDPGDLEHALILADAAGPGRYEVLPGGDPSKHLCFITRREDGTRLIRGWG
jgi:hypothetical protein